ncbi:MAG: conjugal transfer protein TraG [Alphaproteobacteria bacterium]|nr:MAG: conjugal transfer protein TraG [Alphaproteobacteria bacterium]
MQRRWVAMGAGSAISVAACVWASSFIADTFGHQPALGATAISIEGARLYPPWRVFEWSARWSETFPRPFAVAQLIALGGFVIGCIVAALIMRRDHTMKPFADGAWGGFDDAKACGLFARAGAVLGRLDGEVLCFDGPEHQLLIGASRSGKGRGHVVPTLLAWPHSALVLDIKGELADGDERHGFPGTAGFRETIGPVLRFAPTRADSASFNPLFEVRRGPNEVRDVQNIVEILVDPAGDGRHQDFWDRSAKHVLVGLILHVLYVEPPHRKTLATVREKLRDLDATAVEMKSVYHRISPTTGAPEIHPEVLHAAESFLAGEERMQSGIKATAESFFGLFADEIVARKTATSDFRIGDLMCLERPVTLYLQPPPSDALRLTPLMRLIINQFARALMEDQTRDAQGRPKRHRMLLLLDEFPMLGRMPFFEVMMGAMAGYGLKASLVCQSLNHITKAYGRENVILDNCHIVTAFAASDDDTSERISKMAGEVWELRESLTERRPRPLLGWGRRTITMREERRPIITAAQVRALPRDEQLMFVSGAKPIRAKKLKFDQERIFRTRLLPASGERPTLSVAHDWQSVRAIGFIPKTPPAAMRSKPALAKEGLKAQPDLFEQAAVKGQSISERALAGFRGPDGEILPPPGREAPAVGHAQSAASSGAAHLEAASAPEATARRRSKRI